MKVFHLDAITALSTNLKRIRSSKGLTQVDLASASGLKQATVSQIELGKAWPDYKTIVSLCNALKCEHTDLTSHPDLLKMFESVRNVKKEK